MNKRIFVVRQAMLAVCLSVASVVIAQEQDTVSNRPNSEKLASNQLHTLKPLDCNGEPAATSRMTLALGKSTLLRLPEHIVNRTLGNPSVAQAILVSPETLYLLGVEIGSTNMIVQGKSGRCSAIDVLVTMDPAALQSRLQELMPEEKEIRVTAAADSLILSGTVSDSLVASRVHDLALAFVRRPGSVTPGAQQEGMAGGSNTGTNAAQMSSVALQH